MVWTSTRWLAMFSPAFGQPMLGTPDSAGSQRTAVAPSVWPTLALILGLAAAGAIGYLLGQRSTSKSHPCAST